MSTLSSRHRTVSMGYGFVKLDLLLRGRKRAVDHATDVELALHSVLFYRSIVGNRCGRALRVDREGEVDGAALDRAGQVVVSELSDVFTGQLFAVLLEGDGRCAAALIGGDVEQPLA